MNESIIFRRYRRYTYSGQNFDVFCEEDDPVKAIEFYHPRMHFLGEPIRVTQYAGKIYLYNGIETGVIARMRGAIPFEALFRLGMSHINDRLTEYDPREIVGPVERRRRFPIVEQYVESCGSFQ